MNMIDTSAQVAQDVSQIVMIPLNQLEPSDLNSRKTPTSNSADDELIASIKAYGLLKSLVVIPNTNAEEGPHFSVIAGERRRRAMMRLAQEDFLAIDHPVPCRIVPPDTPAETAESMSLAENVVRVAMHPADEFTAFSRLALQGVSSNAIAQRFGCSERLVQQRLRLGNVAEPIMDAYRQGDIDLGVVQDFASSNDRERQLRVWTSLKEQSIGRWHVKSAMIDCQFTVNSKLAMFVGIEAYQEAGGAITVDLFSRSNKDEYWLNDGQLLQDLADHKLNQTAEALREQWKWVEVHPDMEWDLLHTMGRINGQRGEPTEEEQAQIVSLERELEQIEGEDSEDSENEQRERWEEAEMELRRIQNDLRNRQTFPPEAMTVAGCVVTIDETGGLKVHQGLVKKDDLKKVRNRKADDTEPVVEVNDPRYQTYTTDKATRRDGYSQALAERMRLVRSTILKAHLANNFELTFDMAIFQMARTLFGTGYHFNPLDVTMTRTAQVDTNIPDLLAGNQGPKLLEQSLQRLSLDWLKDDLTETEAFQTLRKLPKQRKQHLFAAIIALSLKGQLSGEHLVTNHMELVAASLNIDWAAMFRPTADAFWKHRNKAQIMETAAAVLGNEWVAAHEKDKKAALVKAMENAFATDDDREGQTGLTETARQAALTWTPPGFTADEQDPKPGVVN